MGRWWTSFARVLLLLHAILNLHQFRVLHGTLQDTPRELMPTFPDPMGTTALIPLIVISSVVMRCAYLKRIGGNDLVQTPGRTHTEAHKIMRVNYTLGTCYLCCHLTLHHVLKRPLTYPSLVTGVAIQTGAELLQDILSR